jgi:ribonucleoside-diphosphate reductase alpha chain
VRVTKRNGRKEPFNEEKILRCIERACQTPEEVQRVHYNAKINLYDGVSTKEIDLALIKSARSLIERDPSFKYIASRLLLGALYKEVFGEATDSDAFELQYKKTFIVSLKRLIKAGILNKELAKFDLNKLSEKLIIKRDKEFAYLGLQTVFDRYLMHLNDVRMETPQAFWMRVAMGLAINEPDNREEKAIEFYNVLSQFDFMCSTPTLFNSGGTHNQLSSCFLNTFHDSIQGIFDGLLQEALKNKYAGGLGMDLTNFRATNSYIKGTNGYTQGAVYFWKLYNDMLVAVNQGGKRRGAGCGYIETWHADIEDFLDLRKNTGDDRRRTHDMNTANWIPDEFLRRVQEDKSWYLFSPDEVPELHEIYGKEFEKKYKEYVKKGKAGELRTFVTMSAKELWRKMLRALYETGHPWITFKDPSNIRYSNQHCGAVHSSNLCTEILLHTKPTIFSNNSRNVKELGETAVCNLGSINLCNHITETDEGVVINYKKLEATIKTAMRMLDNVIDINFYPTPEAKKSNLLHRPVGLGSMGWHDVYHKMDILYDSEDAVKLSSDIYEFISYQSIKSSCLLAKERGRYETYEGSLWDQDTLPMDTYREVMKTRSIRALVRARKDLDWSELRGLIKKNGMRNSNTMAIAPTATISSIIGASPSIEPYYSVLYVYSTLSGEFTMLNEFFVNDLKALGLWSEDLIDKIKAADGNLTNISEIPEHVKEKYKGAFQQDQFKLIDAAAARQRWIDQGQSLNLYNSESSLKYLNDLYMHAWSSGLKTTYYLRNKAASQIEKSTVVKTTEPVQACTLGSECESCQ